MNQTRRGFLQTTSLAAAALAIPSLQAHELAGAAQQNVRKGQGLFFNPEDVRRILAATKLSRFAPYWKTLTEANLESDKQFLRNELRFNNHVVDLLRARQILERTSFVYALTHDPRQLEVAKIAIERLLQYAKWDYFLEGGQFTIGLQRAPETTIAMSCAREWLDDALSSELKNEMEKQIAEKGAPACYRTLYGMKYPDRVRGWSFDPESDYAFRFDLSRWPLILNSTNLKVIPIAGLGIAACLLYEKHPQAKKWLDLALQSARAFAPMFGSDGSYIEGVSYWGYTALHMTLFLEVLYRKLGVDERSMINYPGTVRYGLQMSMPTIGKKDDCVNFGDASIVGDVSVAAWVAHRNNDRVAQFLCESIGEIRSHHALIWYDRTIKSVKPGKELYDVRFVDDWVVSRTGWDEQSSVVAMRSGPPGNHEHADRNSVVFKAYGERLLHDPLKAAYSYTQEHWILRKTEAHTAVLIDGKGHQYHDGHEGTNSSWAEANVVQYRASDKQMIVTSDATEAYRLVNADVDLVRRSLVFLKPDVLIFFDQVRMKSQRASVQVRFQAYGDTKEAQLEIGGLKFSIKRPAASLNAMIRGEQELSLRTGVHSVPKEIGVYQYIEASDKQALDHKIVTVCTAQSSGKEHGSAVITRRGSTWVIDVKHNTLSAVVEINAASDLPVITVNPR
ncbi:MAG: heparinase II/III family protein [bacterium]